MCGIQNVIRKDGIYYYRRLIRIGSDTPFRLRLSLKTASRRQAALMAPALTIHCAHLVMRLMEKANQDGLTEQQRAEIFRQQILIERDRLEVMHAKLHIIPPEEQDDIEHALALRLGASEAVARSGAIRGDIEDQIFAHFDPDDDEAPIHLVAWSDLVASLQHDGADEAATARLSDLGLERSDLRQIMARKVVNQARIVAIREFRESLANPDVAYAPVPLPGYNPAPAPLHPVAPQPLPHMVPPAVTAGPWAQLTATEAAQKFFEHNPRTGGKDGKARKGGAAWTPKTREQFKLPALLLEQVMHGRPLATITHDDLVHLDACFRKLHGPTFRKSPSHRSMTIWEIVAETEAKVTAHEQAIAKAARQGIKAGDQKPVGFNKDDLGLGPATTNRHWGFLRQLTDWFAGHHPLAKLDYSAFIIDAQRNPRDERQRYTEDQGRELFSLPPWTGFRSFTQRMKPGSMLVHDAWYFVPLIGWYAGLRREEICGLMLDEIEQSDGLWLFNIRPTEIRRLKTITSARKVPFAGELIRLGLPDYVTAMQDAGEVLLFPELAAESGKGTMGDRYSKRIWSKIAEALPFLQAGQATHSFRHTAIDSMKGAGISPEIRADFAGHALQGETQGRYSKEHLPLLKQAVDVIPVVTDHLEPFAPLLRPPRLRRPSKVRTLSP
jgi:integrase